MPFTQPQSLSSDELYVLTAYLLYINDIVGQDDVIEQIFVSPTPVFIAGAIILLLSPWSLSSFLIFAPVGLATIGAGYLLHRRQKKLIEAGELPAMTPSAGESDELQMSFTVPMAIVVSRELTPLIDKNTPEGARFRAAGRWRCRRCSGRLRDRREHRARRR